MSTRVLIVPEGIEGNSNPNASELIFKSLGKLLAALSGLWKETQGTVRHRKMLMNQPNSPKQRKMLINQPNSPKQRKRLINQPNAPKQRKRLINQPNSPKQPKMLINQPNSPNSAKC